MSDEREAGAWVAEIPGTMDEILQKHLGPIISLPPGRIMVLDADGDPIDLVTLGSLKTQLDRIEAMLTRITAFMFPKE